MLIPNGYFFWFLENSPIVCLSEFYNFAKSRNLFGCISNTLNVYTNGYGTFSNKAYMSSYTNTILVSVCGNTK